MRAMAIVFLAMVGCGEMTAADPEVTGTWSYSLSTRVDEPVLTGKLTLVQSGDAISGALGLPDNYPAGTPWSWTIAGAMDSGVANLTITTCTGCDAAWKLICDPALLRLSCSATQTDNFGDHVGSLTADRLN